MHRVFGLIELSTKKQDLRKRKKELSLLSAIQHNPVLSFVTAENACQAKRIEQATKQVKIIEQFERFSISALTFSVLVNSWEQMVWTLVL